MVVLDGLSWCHNDTHPNSAATLAFHPTCIWGGGIRPIGAIPVHLKKEKNCNFDFRAILSFRAFRTFFFNFVF